MCLCANIATQTHTQAPVLTPKHTYMLVSLHRHMQSCGHTPRYISIQTPKHTSIHAQISAHTQTHVQLSVHTFAQTHVTWRRTWRPSLHSNDRLGGICGLVSEIGLMLPLTTLLCVARSAAACECKHVCLVFQSQADVSCQFWSLLEYVSK